MEFDALIPDAEWAQLISEAYGELFSIVAETGNEYFEYTQSFTTDGTNVLAEPAGHFMTVALTWLVSGDTTGRRIDLRAAEAQERSRLSGRTGPPAYFALVDDVIYLYPTPPSGTVLELRYVEQPPDLTEFSADQSVLVDVVTPDGLTFIIYAVVVKALLKATADPQAAMAEREAARERFTESAILRSINAGHHRVIDKGGDLLEGFGQSGYVDSANWWNR